MPKPDASYATVFSNSVLEHIPDLKPVLAETFRLLRPGGIFYFTVPSHQFNAFSVGHQVLSGLGLTDLAQAFRQRYNRFWRHYHDYPREQWMALATEQGFVIDEAHYYDPPRICLLNDALAPFGLGSFIHKKLTGRWVCCPACRRRVMRPMAAFARRLLAGADRSAVGGLVFVAARKPG